MNECMSTLLWGKTTDAGWSCDYFGGKYHKLAILQLQLLPKQLILLISDASFNFWEKNNMKVEKTPEN